MNLSNQKSLRRVISAAVLAAAVSIGVVGCSTSSPSATGSSPASASQSGPSSTTVAPIPPAASGKKTPSAGAAVAPSVQPAAKGQAVARTRPAPATTPVPPPSAGNIHQVVSAKPVIIAKAVPLTGTANFGGKVTASLVSVAGIKGEARGPGEIAGPAVAVTIEIRNNSSKALDLNAVTVNITNSKGDPGSPLSGSPASPFSGVLKAGDQSRGTYVFSVGAGQRKPISISVSYTIDAPVVVFTGDPS